MRRSRNLGRGGSRSSLNMSGGPLLTEHLKDIDLELELLKRKREMIEQQHQQQQYSLQSYNQQPPPRNYNQQPYYRVQNEHSEPNCDFSHLYNDGPQQQQYRKPYAAKKRQSDNDWQHESFPKRSSGQGQRGGYSTPPAVRNQRPYTAPSQQPKGFKYGQGKYIGHKIANQKPQKPAAKNGVAHKITKPTKAFAPPNRLAAQPVAERSDLVAAAIQSVAEVESREREALRLLPNKVPTKQMTGRLELALGAILRDIREKSAKTPHDETLRTASVQRVMKQVIRDRVRTAMLGKVVGATVEIIQEYRTMFPKETDMEIVNQALQSVSIPPVKPAPVVTIVAAKEKPDEYFRENMCKLIETHLQEMFEKIHEIYNPPETPKNAGEVDFTQDVEPMSAPKEVTEGNTDTNNQQQDETAKPVNIPEGGDNSGEIADAAKKVDIEDLVAKLSNASPHDYKRMLPRLLKRHIPTIIKMLHIHKMYRTAVADLTAATRNKYVEYAKGKTGDAGNTTENAAAVVTTPAKSAPFILPFYVKVMGKPQLPKKKVMQAFLEIFHPKSIKKHRSIHNLLFIGFSEKSDFDAIVQADGTQLGRSTLSIRICDKNTGKPGENANNTAVTDVSANRSADSSDIIGSDLDGQINDLLTSIKNAENENAAKTEADKPEEGKPEETAAADGRTSTENVLDNDSEEKAVTESSPAENNSETEANKSENVDQAEKSETNDQAEKTEANDAEKAEFGEPEKTETCDQVVELKNAASGRSTPTRASARLTSTPATPSSIRTRRASRLMQ